MSRIALLSSILGCLAGAVAAAGIEVEILRPAAGEPLIGEIEIVARVSSAEPIVRVEFSIDGEQAGTVSQAPYRLRVDVGPENRERRLAVVAYGGEGSIGRAERVTPAIPIHDRVVLDLQQLYVTVTDRRGRRVLELAQQDFEILDQTIPQEIVTFARGDVPFTAVLLLDGSVSMKGERLKTVLRGARRFVDDMRPLDEAKLIVFSDRPLRITPFVAGGASLAGALARTSATGGTAILDHLHMALLLLEARQGRRVVILLTDGWDLNSVLTPPQVGRIARRSQAIIYWVRLKRDEPTGGVALRDPGRLIPLSSWHDQETSHRIYKQLEGIVRASGGRIVSISWISEVGDTFREILAELREQYALGYYPQPRRNDGSWRKVRVLLPRHGLNLRTREGYVDW